MVENGILVSDIYKSNVSVKPEIDAEEPEITVLVSDTDDVEVKVIINEKIKAPVKADQKVGEVIYLVNGEMTETLNIIAGKEIDDRNIQIICRYIMKEYFLT